MIIKYEFRTGIMRINAAEFFLLAGRPMIRKMFRMLEQDIPSAAKYVPQIRDYLREHEQEEHTEIARLAKEYMMSETLRVEAEGLYDKDKKMFGQAQKAIKEAKRKSKALQKQISEARKREQKYKDIQVDVVKIFGESEGV